MTNEDKDNSKNGLASVLPTLNADLRKSENGKHIVLDSVCSTSRPLNEKIIYRTKKQSSVLDKLNGDSSRCESTDDNERLARSPSRALGSPRKMARDAHSSMNHRSIFVDHFRTNTRKNSQQRARSNLNKSLDWTNLGDKIEDWFDGAKTPDQRVVYNFLNDLNQNEDGSASVVSEESKMGERVRSLEDILDNLKGYKKKLNEKHLKENKLPQIGGGNKNALKSNYMSNLFESSTWRVMRHIRSADIRNKYPLPKANPDEHFRNSTVFYVANRPPKSTFLLHPDWV